MKQYDPEIESLVDENQSREELERQVMDNNYMREKMEEQRMNESFRSDRSNGPVKAIAFQPSSKPSLYKPPLTKAISDKPHEEPENIESIEERIKRQLEEFHRFKNMALEDCEEFLDDIESRCDDEGNKLVQIPEDFDDIVDIAVDEQSQAQQDGEEILDEDGKPFWMKYFKADYLGESDPTYQKLLAKQGINAEPVEETKGENLEIKKKLLEEWSKIKSLDSQIVNTNKVYKVMKDNASKREEGIRERMRREKEEKQKELDKKKKSYIKSNTTKRQSSSRASSRSKASETSKASSKAKKSSKGFSSNPFSGMRRPSSGRNAKKQPQKQVLDGKVEEEKSGTFLTGVQAAGKYAKMDQRIKDELGYDLPNDDEEFDPEKARTHEIDMINAYEEALNESPRRRKKYTEANSSLGSEDSPKKMNFIKQNAKSIGPTSFKSYTNHLSEREKSRLLALEDEIEQSFLGDEDTAKKILAISGKPEHERLELMSALIPASEAGVSGVIAGMKNAYVYEDGERMEQINDVLKSKFLALPPCTDDASMHDDVSSMHNAQMSAFGDKKGSDKNVDVFSERSVQLSQMTKRSGLSNYSHSIISKLSKPVSLPKEKILREQAESKLYKSSIKEIDDCISQIHTPNTDKPMSEDQISRLVDECRRENDRVAMLETNEEDEDSDGTDRGYKGQSYSSSIMLYSDKNTKLSEAQEMLDYLVMHTEALKRGEILPLENGSEEDVIDEKEQLEDEEADLKRRLQEQEDNLAAILREIEEKESKLKAAIEENNKYLDMEEGIMTNEGEISARTAAYKFSSMRGNHLKLTKGHNPEVPDEKVIEELPEEDDEEENRLNAMLEDARHFNEDFDASQSNDFASHHSAAMEALSYLQSTNSDPIYASTPAIEEYDEYEEYAEEVSNPNDAE